MLLKSEGRSPKSERRPKPEARSDQHSPEQLCRRSRTSFRISDFGFRPSFGFRISAFGFSLIEIMVTVGLLSFIVLGLLLMFNQTQRAFRSGMTQTDVLESGRATVDLLARELEQMAPSRAPDFIDQSGIRRRATNFFVEPANTYYGGGGSPGSFSWFKPLVQELPGNTLPRTNLVQRFYFLSKINQDWIGIGYEVVPDDPNQNVGTLYRYCATNNPRNDLLPLSSRFLITPITNLSRIADGVVHLRLRAYAANGRLITTNSVTGTNAMYQVRFNGPYTNIINAVAYNSVMFGGSHGDLRQAACYFMSNAVPAYLELEFGILEPQTLQKYRSIPTAPVARQYLSNHVAQVHVFRQRIPVRNVDLTAYQ